jgi:hypothetical protein
MADEKDKGKTLEEFKLTFKNGALKNLQRLAVRFKADGDLENVVAKAIKLLTYVQGAKDGKVLWDTEKDGRFFVDIENL